jgi:hypothetical protein
MTEQAVSFRASAAALCWLAVVLPGNRDSLTSIAADLVCDYLDAGAYLPPDSCLYSAPISARMGES